MAAGPGRRRIAAATLAVSTLTGAAPLPYSVSISGDADVRFAIDCESGSETHHHQGAPPHDWQAAGPGLACMVRQTAGSGQLRVQMDGPTGNRSTAGTSGAGSVVHVRME